MRRLLPLLFVVLFSSFSGPGPAIKAKYDFFEVDNFGNIYTIKNEELCKFLPVALIKGDRVRPFLKSSLVKNISDSVSKHSREEPK